MINTSIDQFRKELKYKLSGATEQTQTSFQEPHVIDELSHKELIGLVQKLSPGYRAVFNLYVIDGYNHEEIAKMLHISSGTSKSNLMKARENLRRKLEGLNRISYEKVNG